MQIFVDICKRLFQQWITPGKLHNPGNRKRNNCIHVVKKFFVGVCVRKKYMSSTKAFPSIPPPSIMATYIYNIHIIEYWYTMQGFPTHRPN